MPLPTFVSDMVLYHYWRSGASWRVRIALELKGLRPKYVHVDLLSGEVDREPHLSRNPIGHVPVLEVNSRYIAESIAIMEWLDEVVPTPCLYPGDAFDRAHIRALCELFNSGTQPIVNLPVLDEISQDPEARKKWSQVFIRRGMHAFETMAKPRAGKFVFGDTFTAADILLIPQCYSALRNDIQLDEFPLLKRIYEHAMTLPEVKNSHPDRYKP